MTHLKPGLFDGVAVVRTGTTKVSLDLRNAVLGHQEALAQQALEDGAHARSVHQL